MLTVESLTYFEHVVYSLSTHVFLLSYKVQQPNLGRLSFLFDRGWKINHSFVRLEFFSCIAVLGRGSGFLPPEK